MNGFWPFEISLVRDKEAFHIKEFPMNRSNRCALKPIHCPSCLLRAFHPICFISIFPSHCRMKRPHTDWRRWAQEWLHVYHSLGSAEYSPNERRSYQKMCVKLRDNMKSRLYYECEEKELCTIQVVSIQFSKAQSDHENWIREVRYLLSCFQTDIDEALTPFILGWFDRIRLIVDSEELWDEQDWESAGQYVFRSDWGETDLNSGRNDEWTYDKIQLEDLESERKRPFMRELSSQSDYLPSIFKPIVNSSYQKHLERLVNFSLCAISRCFFLTPRLSRECAEASRRPRSPHESHRLCDLRRIRSLSALRRCPIHCSLSCRDSSTSHDIACFI